MQIITAAVLFLALAISNAQGNQVCLSNMVLWSSHYGDQSCGCDENGIPIYKVRPNEDVSFSADVHVEGQCLDLWGSLRWEDGCESATRSHVCPNDCSSLFLAEHCAHTSIDSGDYYLERFHFKVPNFKCGCRTYVRFWYWADWFTSRVNQFDKTYEIPAQYVWVDIEC